MKSVSELLELLRGVKPSGEGRWMALCPAHNDRNPSLSVTALPDKILVSCQAGCPTSAVLKALNLKMSNLFFDSHKATSSALEGPKDIVATYDYQDESGKLLHQTVRFEPKEFSQRRPDKNGKWIWNLRGIKPVIYHLPRVKEAIDKGETIFLAEGEKDADNLISHLGLVATTSPMGAGKWRQGYAKMLTGAKEVVVIADNDPPGLRHAQAIATSLLAVQVPTKLLEMPSADIKDISDWISAGLTADQFKEVIDGLPAYEPLPTGLTAKLEKETGAEMELTDYHLTDAGNAEYFTHLYGDIIRYDHLRSRWLHWQKHHWQPEIDGHIMRLALKAVRNRFAALAGINDLELKEKIAKWCISSEQRTRLESCLAIARNLKPIAEAGDKWDNNNWLFCVKNGVIDLRTGELRPGRQEDMLTMQSQVVYDTEAEVPRWTQFLDEIFSGDTDLITYQQRYYGYCLTGDTQEQTVAIFHGKGANGKTRLLSILRHVFGDYAYDAPFSTFELNQRAAIPNDLAALVNKRVVTSSETNEGTRLNEARIKALSGQDSITARFLHCEFFTFDPMAKILLAVNHRPRVRDDSYGFWRKVRLIPFNREFKGKADDKRLGEKLISESSGILNWLIQGCLTWQKQGLEPTPDCVLQATQEYRAESDPLSQFTIDALGIHPQAQVKARAFYKAYLSWADDQGLQKKEILTSTAFGRLMGQKFKKTHDRTGAIYWGVGLKCDGFVTGFISEQKKNEVNSYTEPSRENELENGSQPVNPSQVTDNSPLTEDEGQEVDYPHEKCPTCGGDDFWPLTKEKRWLCSRCQPEPKEIDREV